MRRPPPLSLEWFLAQSCLSPSQGRVLVTHSGPAAPHLRAPNRETQVWVGRKVCFIQEAGLMGRRGTHAPKSHSPLPIGGKSF